MTTPQKNTADTATVKEVGLTTTMPATQTPPTTRAVNPYTIRRAKNTNKQRIKNSTTIDGKAIESSNPSTYPTNDGILHCGNISCPFAAPAPIKTKNIIIQLKTSIETAIQLDPSLRYERWYRSYYIVWLGEGLLDNFNDIKLLEGITCWPREPHPNPTYNGILHNIERIIPSKYLHSPPNFKYNTPTISVAAAPTLFPPTQRSKPPAALARRYAVPKNTNTVSTITALPTPTPTSNNINATSEAATIFLDPPLPSNPQPQQYWQNMPAPVNASAYFPSSLFERKTQTLYRHQQLCQIANAQNANAIRPPLTSPTSVILPPSQKYDSDDYDTEKPPNPFISQSPLPLHALAAHRAPPSIKPSKLQLKPHAFTARRTSPSPLPPHAFATHRLPPIIPHSFLPSPSNNNENITFEDDNPACHPSYNKYSNHIEYSVARCPPPSPSPPLSPLPSLPPSKSPLPHNAFAARSTSPTPSPTTTATTVLFNYHDSDDDDDIDIHPNHHHLSKSPSSTIKPSPAIKTLRTHTISITNNFPIEYKSFVPPTIQNSNFDDDDPSIHTVTSVSSSFSNDENAIFEDDDPPSCENDDSSPLFPSQSNYDSDNNDDPNHSAHSYNTNPYDSVYEEDEHYEWEYYHS